MLDHRMETFLVLCERMNYRQSAETLHMTQPAVTHHIQALERAYGCKLFHYDGRKLRKTAQGELLERYGRCVQGYETLARRKLECAQTTYRPRIGVTKTIGEFVVRRQIKDCVRQGKASFVIDNTAYLLRLLDAGALDLALVEGSFDRERYTHWLYGQERFVGICSDQNPLAGRAVALEELLDQRLILREEGSGTRQICQQMLSSRGYAPSDFADQISISDFGMLVELVREHAGISFVYEAVAKSDEALGVFTIQDLPITREFYFLCLPQTEGERYASLLSV